MPKAKWSNTDLTTDDIDEVTPDQFKRYTGPSLVGNGPAVYKVRLGRLTKAESKAGNDKIKFMAFVDGQWREESRKYDGAPIFDDIPLTKGAAPRVRAFCDALGVTSRDLLERCVTDDQGVILKIGNKDVSGEKKQVHLLLDCEIDRSGDNPRVRPRFRGYLPLDDEDGSGDSGEDVGTASRGKKGKGKDKSDDGDVPF